MTITPLTHDAVDDFVRAHIALQHVTYAHLANAGHAEALWTSFDDRVAGMHEAIDRPASEENNLIARGVGGAVVAVGSAFVGVGEWERNLFGEAWRPSGADWCLDTIYVMPSMRGSGLGQRLLDALLPDRRSAYLWVMTANPGAIRFYERNGFVADGFGGTSGENWGALDMIRMVRT
ncbi:MAG: GNAT family N-acetyltransferase [Micrococcus sp.]|nr:GNAT family N-acetyltransferase [Micrococcus sp.]